jgi:hypothetical protein
MQSKRRNRRDSDRGPISIAFVLAAIENATSAMKSAMLTVVALMFAICTFAQTDLPTFKVHTRSALVWDEVSPGNASSIIWDPLTGRELHRLTSGGVEVSSLVGYERVGLNTAFKLLNYTTTIANNTDSDLSVQYGGAVVDGHTALPLWVALTNKGFRKRDRKEIWELSKMHCFTTGFSSKEHFFSADNLSKTFTIRPRTVLTVSSVTMDPRLSSAMCSVDGCHITGTIRYYITVNSRDYVFVWPGRSVAYCGV